MLEQPRTPSTLSWDGWLRFFVIGYFLGGILGLWSLWLKETLAPGGFTPTMGVLWATVVTPTLSLIIGYVRFRRGRYALLQATPTMPYQHGGCVLLAFGIFGLWCATYYASGLWVASESMMTLATALDHATPLIPESTFIYITVQCFLVLALTLIGDRLPWRPIVAACTANIIVSTACFMFFPVTMHHVQVPVTDLSTWTLATLRVGDLANNCFPSSHCSMAMLSTLLLFRVSRLWGWLGLFSTLAIGVTTLTTKQHYLADVLAGFALAGISYMLWCRPKAQTARDPKGVM